jgi:hypothetical protein
MTTTPSLQSVKLNVVLTRDVNLSEMLDFVRLTENERLSVRFIEFMPFSGTFTTRVLLGLLGLAGKMLIFLLRMGHGEQEMNGINKRWFLTAKRWLSFVTSTARTSFKWRMRKVTVRVRGGRLEVGRVKSGLLAPWWVKPPCDRPAWWRTD